MKRYLVALGAAAMVGSVVAGSAAALNVDGGVVQSGVDGTLTCDSDGVEVIQRSEFDTPVPYSVGPQVTGIDEACSGQNLVVTAFDSSGAQIGQSTTVGITGTTVNGSWDTGNLELEDIYRLVVTIVS